MPASTSADLEGLLCALSPVHPGAATHTASPWSCVPSPQPRGSHILCHHWCCWTVYTTQTEAPWSN